MTVEPELRQLRANGIRLNVAMAGEGALVVLCHGWPESWRSWRHQLGAISAAGYRVAAPDMRGFGLSEAPEGIEAYTILHLVADMVGLVEALGEKQATIIGHDWGAVVAWHAALLRADMFTAVAGLGVPYSPPSRRSLLDLLELLGLKDSYLNHFQKPGVAEAELERDIELSLLQIITGAMGDASADAMFSSHLPSRLLGSSMTRPEIPPWLAPGDLAALVESFRGSGFRGGLNWYRNIRLNAELLGPWHGCPVTQPALFIAGEKDPWLRIPFTRTAISALPRHVPRLVQSILLDGVGHWTQQERPAEVSSLLIGFLKGRRAENRAGTQPEAVSLTVMPT